MQSQYLLDDSRKPSNRKEKLRNCLLILLSLMLFMLLVCIIMNFIFTKAEKDKQDENSICKIINKNISYSNINGLIKCDCKQQFYLNNSNSRCFQYLYLSIDGQQSDYLQILVRSDNNSQFQLQDKYPFSHYQNSRQLNNSQWKVELQTNPFAFIITRSSNNQILFDTRGHEFIFTERYIQFSTKLQNSPIGLGLQNTDELYLQDGEYTLFPQNNGNKLYDSQKGQNQLSGHHPVYLVRDGQQWSAFYLKNYYPMSVLWNADQKVLTFEIIGGNIDIRMFKKDSTDQQSSKQNVVELYHRFINKQQYRFPFWTYSDWMAGDVLNSTQQINNTINDLLQNGIHIQNVLSDSQYLENDVQLMVQDQFKQEDILEMKSRNIRWIATIKYGLQKDSQQSQQAENEQILINIRNRTLVGCSLMNETVYLDYNHNKTHQYWQNVLEQLNDRIQFAGIYLDDNQIYNMIDYGLEKDQKCNQVYQTNYSNQFPYWPGKVEPGTKGLDFNAKISSKGRYVNWNEQLTEYDMHSVNGYLQTLETAEYWANQAMYLLVSETTIPETGGVAGHVIKNYLDNDQQNSYQSIKRLLFQIVKLNLFGIQQIGIYLPTDSVHFKSLYNLGTLLPLRINYLQQRQLEEYNNTIIYSNKIRHKYIKQVYSYLFKQSSYITDQTDGQQMIWYQIVDLVVLLQVDGQQRYVDWSHKYTDQQGNIVVGKSNITLSNGLQIFQKSNSMVFYQSQNVSSIDQLDHQFNVSVFISNNQSSVINGTLLAIDDYFNSSSVHRCYHTNCLSILSMNVSIDSSYIQFGLKNYMDLSSSINIQFIDIHYQVNANSTNSITQSIQQSLNTLKHPHQYKISI